MRLSAATGVLMLTAACMAHQPQEAPEIPERSSQAKEAIDWDNLIGPPPRRPEPTMEEQALYACRGDLRMELLRSFLDGRALAMTVQDLTGTGISPENGGDPMLRGYDVVDCEREAGSTVDGMAACLAGRIRHVASDYEKKHSGAELLDLDLVRKGETPLDRCVRKVRREERVNEKLRKWRTRMRTI